MTSRLKRKLNDLGVDPTSSKANESFCQIGTPLPPLEKSKDTGEFVPLWKQDVRDEQGRRRLHGAFTGGFSAGYFNTVGSKEGWAPSTFVSSRSDRAKAKAARPEDFMDEEDLAELRDSRKLVDENEEMDFGGTQAELQRRAGAGVEDEGEKDPITSALEASLAPAPKDSVGARILKKMGWRIGQGIGPRLTYAQRKAQDKGFLDPSRETEGDEEDEEAKKHLYPRRDTPVLLAPRKDNFHGLGYVPGMRLEESVGSGQEQGPRISSGFGLGALNDAEDDDVEIYDTTTGRQGRPRMAFDIADEDDGRHITIGSSSARHPTTERGPRVTPATVTQMFSDGRPVLKGFVVSSRPVAEDRWYPLPEIPKGWTPNPRRVWEQETNKENIQAPSKLPPKTHVEWKASLMSADERGALLGETPLPSQPRSVFEYMSQKDRERLQNIKNAVPAPFQSTSTSVPGRSSPTPPPTQRVPGEINIPYLHPSVAKAALQGFQPFTADPIKQSRYMAFLNFQASRGSVVPGAPNATGIGIGPNPGQSNEEFNKELEDYAKAATVFKPLSGAMAGRFRSAVVVETGPTVVEGLHQPTSSTTNEEAAKEEQDEMKEEDPKTGAVRLGMYGPLTREVRPWQPARLLCKRFGVKDPEVDTSSVDAGATADFAPTAAAKESWKQEAGIAEAGPSSSTVSNFVSAGAITDGTLGGDKRRNGPRDLANVGLGEDEDQGRDTLTYQRPAMDIFKAIFASDDEDSDDEDPADDEGNDVVKEEPIETPIVGPDVKASGEVKAESIPVHLAVGDSASASYEPKQDASSTATAPEKVDLASFKPTFIPRTDRESRKDKAKDKKDKKKSSGKAALMSFDVDEDGFGPNLGVPSSRKKDKERDKDKEKERKKKKRKERQERDEDESMWIEKPPPEAVKSISVELPVPPAESAASEKSMSITHEGTDVGEARPPRGRKRAIDFM